MANDTSYGLGASVFTKDIRKGHRVARKLQAGQVWINSSNDGAPSIPFGGFKNSGIGRELGEYAISVRAPSSDHHETIVLTIHRTIARSRPSWSIWEWIYKDVCGRVLEVDCSSRHVHERTVLVVHNGFCTFVDL